MRLSLFPAARALLVAATLLLAASPAIAGTYYVDAVNGDDANGGTSPGDAWRTITRATTALTSGSHVVHVAPGLYDAALGESFPIVLRSGMDLRGAGRDVTIVDGDGAGSVFRLKGQITEFPPFSYFRGMWVRDCGYALDGRQLANNDEAYRLEVLDSRFSDASSNAIKLHVYALFSFGDLRLTLRVRRTRIESCGTAIAATAAGTDDQNVWGELLVEDCELVACEDAVQASIGERAESNMSVTVRRSRIVDCLGVGVEAQGNTLSIYDSLIAGNETGVRSDCFSGSSIRGATIAFHADTGLVAMAPIALSSSIVYGNADDVHNPGAISASHSDVGDGDFDGTSNNISADPVFHAPGSGDFRLRFGSPCIDAGGARTSTSDLLGLPRIVDGDLDAIETLDMGAIEFAPLQLSGNLVPGGLGVLELWGPLGAQARLYTSFLPLLDPPLPGVYGQLELDGPQPRTLASMSPGPPVSLPFVVPSDFFHASGTRSFQALVTVPGGSPPFVWTNGVSFTIP